MNATAWARIGGALICLLSACSVTRPVPIALDAPGVSAYLTDNPRSNLQVTERSGRRYWVHEPRVSGDSLLGQLGYDVPVQPLSVPLEEVEELRTSHFSWGRTGAVVAGSMAAAFVALAILVEGAEPTY